MSFDGHFTALEPAECAHLVRTGLVGRVGFASSQGLVILPVNYVVVDGVIHFRTDPTSVLAELREPCDVAFQVDEYDDEVANGWTVLIQGRSDLSQNGPAPSLKSWAPGDRAVGIAINPVQYSGRAISASQ